MVRGKFQLIKISEHIYNKNGKELVFNAVYRGQDENDENTRYHTATPSGKIEMFVDNVEALKAFELGSFYYVDFNKVP